MQAGWMTSGGMMTPGSCISLSVSFEASISIESLTNFSPLSLSCDSFPFVGGSIGPKTKLASSPKSQSPEPRSGDRTPISANDPRRRSMEVNGGHQRSQSSLSQFLTNRTSYHAPPSPSDGTTPPLEPNSLSPHAGRKSASNPIKELGKGMKALGGKVGLEFETNGSRPSQAKSSAGVFGGLIAATVSLLDLRPLRRSASSSKSTTDFEPHLLFLSGKHLWYRDSRGSFGESRFGSSFPVRVSRLTPLLFRS